MNHALHGRLEEVIELGGFRSADLGEQQASIFSGGSPARRGFGRVLASCKPGRDLAESLQIPV